MIKIVITLAFNLIDYLTGLTYAVMKKSVSSKKLRDGLFKKFGFFICYIIGFLIDKYGYLFDFEISVSILNFVLGYVILTEIVSIFENLTKINPKITPDLITRFFKKNKEE